MSSDQVALISCPHCAAQMPATASFCPGCGRPIVRAVPSQSTQAAGPGDSLAEPQVHSGAGADAYARVGPLPANILGALAYFTFIPAVIFLLVDPYKKNRFIRFHSIQCLLLWALLLLVSAALKLAAMVLYFIPIIGPLLITIASVLLAIAAVVIWLVFVVKALRHEAFSLPILGNFVESFSGV